MTAGLEARPPSYVVADFATIAGVACPCGTARRAFADVADFPATVHVTEIAADARLHYHRRLTETYFILECGDDARMELDGDLVPVRPGVCVLIPPGVRHRAVGRMRVLILVLPKFDPDDEWFDVEGTAGSAEAPSPESGVRGNSAIDRCRDAGGMR